MQKIKIVLDIMTAEDIAPFQVQEALKGMGFRYYGVHHQPVEDERYSIPFYKFFGKIDRTRLSESSKFKMAYKE